MAYIVYCHTNKINGEKYIGITSTTPEKRWQNGKGYKNNKYFSAAIQKYGWENFKHDIVLNNLTKEQAELQEKYLISFYKTTDKNFGYNISNGGEGVGKHSEETKYLLSQIAKNRYLNSNNPMLGKHHTAEAKQKMSLKLKGRIIDDNWKQKLSEAGKGRIVSQETRTKISKIHKGKKSSLKNKKRPDNVKLKISQSKKKPVICLNDNKIFASITEASVYYNVDNSAIGKICKHQKKSIKGLVFEFYIRGD